MSLIRDLCQQRAIPVMINMHDVELAKRFADRIIGMAQGTVVYDGPPTDLSDTQLKVIYGGQEWLHSQQ
jgi:phosphonate transport system ATP-binding protein